MRRGEMTLPRLWKLLRTLPWLPTGEHCSMPQCKDYGIGANRAILRDPATGEYLCRACALVRMEDSAHKADIELAVRIRRFFLTNPTECSECASSAQRLCSYCAAPICEEHKVFIPRNGCACRRCAKQLEEEEAVRTASSEEA